MQRLIVNVPRTILEKKHDRIKIDKVDGSVDHEILHRVIHQKVDLVCKLICIYYNINCDTYTA